MTDFFPDINFQTESATSLKTSKVSKKLTSESLLGESPTARQKFNLYFKRELIGTDFTAAVNKFSEMNRSIDRESPRISLREQKVIQENIQNIERNLRSHMIPQNREISGLLRKRTSIKKIVDVSPLVSRNRSKDTPRQLAESHLFKYSASPTGGASSTNLLMSQTFLKTSVDEKRNSSRDDSKLKSKDLVVMLPFEHLWNATQSNSYSSTFTASDFMISLKEEALSRTSKNWNYVSRFLICSHSNLASIWCLIQNAIEKKAHTQDSLKICKENWQLVYFVEVPK